jgi:hypothetical protein
MAADGMAAMGGTAGTEATAAAGMAEVTAATTAEVAAAAAEALGAAAAVTEEDMDIDVARTSLAGQSMAWFLVSTGRECLTRTAISRVAVKSVF